MSLRRRIPLSARTPLLEADAEAIELGELTASEISEFGTFATIEEAAATLDATGVGAPLGIAFGILGAVGFSAYEIYEHFKSHPQTKNLPHVNVKGIQQHIDKKADYLAKGRKINGNQVSDKNLIKKLDVTETDYPGKAVPSYETATETGFVPPPYKYLGPGNSLNRGHTNIQIDQDAHIHDTEYSKAKTQQDIEKSDRNFISKSGDHIAEAISGTGSLFDTVGAVAGGIGIGTKYLAEQAVGGIYPNRELWALCEVNLLYSLKAKLNYIFFSATSCGNWSFVS